MKAITKNTTTSANDYFTDTDNFRLIQFKFIAPTNKTDARIQVKDAGTVHDARYAVKYFKSDAGALRDLHRLEDKALHILRANGWDVGGRCNTPEFFGLLCNNWAEDFKSIDDLTL